MWSIVQRRHIAKLVDAEIQKQPSNLEREIERARSSDSTGLDQDGELLIEEDNVIVVRKNGDYDPMNPHNWSLVSRAKNIAILCILVFVQGWAGSAESIGNEAASRAFGVSQVAMNLATAMYLFGVGTGSLFAGPLSETFGRNPVYLVATFCYLCFVLGCALVKSFAGLIVCRYFVGLTASATLSINGASVNDQFRPVKRAFVFPVVAWANVTAPMIAPIANGWIVSDPALGRVWAEWVTLIISSAAFLLAAAFLPETYFPLLLEWKARALRRATGDRRYTSDHARAEPLPQRVRKNLPLPIIFFTKEPVITVLGSYLILLYILLFSFLSGFDYIFKQTYQLSTGLEGSCFASIALGATTFTLYTPGLYKWARWHTLNVRRAQINPEFRLWPAILTAPFLPISLFWLGWTNYPDIPIYSGLAACFIFGIVLTSIYVSSYEYITDSYKHHAATALASITMARYLISGGMVMAARPMYEGIGVHWTMTLLGILSLILTPAPFIFWRMGPRLREKSKYAMSPRSDGP